MITFPVSGSLCLCMIFGSSYWARYINFHPLGSLLGLVLTFWHVYLLSATCMEMAPSYLLSGVVGCATGTVGEKRRNKLCLILDTMSPVPSRREAIFPFIVTDSQKFSRLGRP